MRKSSANLTPGSSSYQSQRFYGKHQHECGRPNAFDIADTQMGHDGSHEIEDTTDSRSILISGASDRQPKSADALASLDAADAAGNDWSLPTGGPSARAEWVALPKAFHQDECRACSRLGLRHHHFGHNVKRE